MARRDVHSRRKQSSGADDDELLTEAQITDSEFLERVYGKELRLYATALCQGKTYGGDGPDDLVQSAIGAVVEGKEKWSGQTVKSFRWCLRPRVKRDFIDLTRKHGLKRHAELEEADTVERRMQPAKVVIQMVDLQSFIRLVKQRVPNVKGEHKCIDLWFANYTVAETAEKLGMSVDRVKKMRARILEAISDVVTPDMIPVY